MAEFNKFSMYSLVNGATEMPKQDELDKHIDFLKGENDYDEVRNYLLEHFGDVPDESKWVDFPELNKQCYLVVSSERVEFCVEKNHKQYYGKGWLKINKQ
ncbi:hypothetical protein IJ384_00030 [bacterium]|nr:hypothetical protein [bacterium]